MNIVKIFICLLVVVSASTGTFAADVKPGETVTFTVQPEGTLYWKSAMVTAEVVASAGNRVEIHFKEPEDIYDAEDLLDYLKIEVRQDGNDIYFTSELDKDKKCDRRWSKKGKKSVRFEVLVPDRYNIEFNTAIGGISVKGLNGSVAGSSSVGNIALNNIEGAIDVESNAGSVKVEQIRGKAEITSNAGSVSIKHAEGDITANSNAGSITIQELKGSINATSSAGSIKLTLTESPARDSYLTSSAGKVIVSLTDDVGFDLDAEATLGRIHTDFPVTMKGSFMGTSIRGPINQGGVKMKIQASIGSIELKRI